MSSMRRNTLRVFFVLVLLALAVCVPLVASGYSELNEALHSDSYSEAAAHYQAAAQRVPWRADLYELAGHAHYHAKDYDRANAAYQKAFSRHALSPVGWMAWGDVHYLNDDPDGARQIWEEALQQPDPSDQLYSRLADIYQSNGDFAKAAEYLQKYVSAYPEDASAHYRLGLLLSLADPDHAAGELIQAAQLDSQFDPAVQTLRTALNLASLNDSYSERLVILGRGLGLVNEWLLARDAFESAVEQDEKNAEALAWLGEANQQTGRDGSAELERALTLDPNSPAVRGLRGLYFQRTGNFRQALAEFQAAAALEPNNYTWLVSAGESYAKLGDLIRALEAYQAATTLAPSDANTWRLLAIFCAQNNVNVADVGIPAAQQAVVLAKVDAPSLDALGWLFILDSRYEEADETLMHALKKDAKSSSVHLHLGMLYLQTGKRDQAREHFLQARDLGSEDAQIFLKQYFP